MVKLEMKIERNGYVEVGRTTWQEAKDSSGAAVNLSRERLASYIQCVARARNADASDTRTVP
jgi:hypothetical protein